MSKLFDPNENFWIYFQEPLWIILEMLDSDFTKTTDSLHIQVVTLICCSPSEGIHVFSFQLQLQYYNQQGCILITTYLTHFKQNKSEIDSFLKSLVSNIWLRPFSNPRNLKIKKLSTYVFSFWDLEVKFLFRKLCNEQKGRCTTWIEIVLNMKC